jgi:hypothetical protein
MSDLAPPNNEPQRAALVAVLVEVSSHFDTVIRDALGFPATSLGGFRYRVGTMRTRVSGNDDIKCLARQDVTTATHADLTAGT